MRATRRCIHTRYCARSSSSTISKPLARFSLGVFFPPPPRPTLVCRTLPHLSLFRPVIPCPTLFHSALPYSRLPFPTLPYLIPPYPTLFHPTLPYPTVPYRTLPYPTPPYPTIPYPTLPYPAVPSGDGRRWVLGCSGVVAQVEPAVLPRQSLHGNGRRSRVVSGGGERGEHLNAPYLGQSTTRGLRLGLARLLICTWTALYRAQHLEPSKRLVRGVLDFLP